MRKIIMPQFGETSEESIKIVNWAKKTGEKVIKGEVLLEVETDKVTMDVEAADSGILVKIEKQEMEDVKPGDVIGYLAAD